MSKPAVPEPETTWQPSPESMAFSNSVRLSLREWLIVGIFSFSLIAFGPAVWRHFEKFEPGPDFRIPDDLSYDYWLFDRHARQAAERYDLLLVGDSVVWGAYVKPEGTLAHYLNEESGREFCANLGLQGTSPIFLAGLLEHHGNAIANKDVLLQCNLLWMSSPQADLQAAEKVELNHPRLAPQFSPWIPCCKEEISTRIGIVIEQRTGFGSWPSHLQQAYFQQKSIPAWTLEHPYENPFAPLFQELSIADKPTRNKPIPWTERDGVKLKDPTRDFSWVDPDTSLQWQAFRRAVQVLQARGNRVFVLLGPFNEHMLSAKGQVGYVRMKSAVETWLREQDIPYFAPPALPSAEYADASHPLAAGYARLARDLWPHLDTVLRKTD